MPDLHGRAAFVAVAYVFVVALAFTTVPTPLWVVYAARDDLSSLIVTVAFAGYALGVVVSLLLAGHVSDWLGRRRVLLPALGLEVIAAVVLLASPSLPGLLVGRVLTGLGAGALIATATAWMGELWITAEPGRSERQAARVTSMVNFGGLGVGALVSGALAEWGGDPVRLPYVVSLVALLAAVVLAALAPETRPAVRPRPRYRPQRVSVPEGARGSFFAAAGAAFAAFAAFGMFACVAPSFLAVTLGDTSHALAGVTAFGVCAAGALALGATAAWPLPRLVRAGSYALPAGLSLMVAGLWLSAPSLALFLIGGVIVGAGAGLLFTSSIAAGTAIALPGRRAETLAGLFVAGYLGLGAPVIGLGLLTELVAQRVALLVFATALAVGTIAAVPALLGRSRPVRPAQRGSVG